MLGVPLKAHGYLPREAMQSAAYAVVRCLSVTFAYFIEMSKHHHHYNHHHHHHFIYFIHIMQ